ncbi:MAG: DUF11 domain-containing protein [Actinomycetota bacterium]|nr:DUF11 domain-containing protein [Actinomycetota bacterium]
MTESPRAALSRAGKSVVYYLLLATLAFAGVGLGGSPIAHAAGSVPTVDLAIVSKTADVSRAHPGQLVTYAIVATNFGPDNAPSLDVTDLVDFQASGFQVVDESCDQGVSADTPSCEYSDVAPGETVATIVTVRVLKHFKLKVATNQACATSEVAVVDTNPANDCLTVTLPLTGTKKL